MAKNFSKTELIFLFSAELLGMGLLFWTAGALRDYLLVVFVLAATALIIRLKLRDDEN
jgi:hypothetical protein